MEIYLRINPHCSSSLRAVLNLELSCSFVADNTSSLNMPIFFFANTTIIAMWILGDLKREAYNASNSCVSSPLSEKNIRSKF